MSDQMNAVYIVGEIVQERDRLRRELDELRSAARKAYADVVESGLLDGYTLEYVTDVLSPLAALVGVEDTTEATP